MPAVGVPEPTLGFVSTYPPTQCGLATFTRSLVGAITVGRQEQRSVGVVRVLNDHHDPAHGSPEVVACMDPALPISVRAAAARLNTFQVAIVQHEFGIFGPDDGAAALDLLERVEVPAIATLHTVPSSPSARQRAILEDIVETAACAVVMSHSARRELEGKYATDPGKIRVIPHGAHGYAEIPNVPGDRPVVLTWGLIGPGKGIEWGIRALPMLRHIHPRPLYRVCGATHPKVLRAEGERYRAGLQALAGRLGVKDMLEFRNSYLDNDALAYLVGSADIVLLPYDSRDQGTSGVLIDAIAAGKPVVSTRFPHAVELLSGGAGRVVPHQDPEAMAGALQELFTNRAACGLARHRARRLARSLAWPAVAGHYARLAALLTQCEATEVA